jgi:hypothetical protein
MTDVLNRNLFLIKERAGLLNTAYECDVLDPENGQLIMKCGEESLTRAVRFLRLFNLFKGTTPFDIRIETPDGRPVVRVVRGVPVFASRVKVYDHENNLIGGFRQKAFSFAGALDVLDANDEVVCQVAGKLAGWRRFYFVTPEGVELAVVSKKWAGLGREFFTSADDYMLQIDEVVPRDSTTRRLVLASVICIGLIFKIEIP